MVRTSKGTQQFSSNRRNNRIAWKGPDLSFVVIRNLKKRVGGGGGIYNTVLGWFTQIIVGIIVVIYKV